MKMFQINESDLEVLEREIPNIFDLAAFSDAYNKRPDIQEAADMIKKIISNVRWNYGPPFETHSVEIGGKSDE
jgi:hypothetical protein